MLNISKSEPKNTQLKQRFWNPFPCLQRWPESVQWTNKKAHWTTEHTRETRDVCGKTTQNNNSLNNNNGVQWTFELPHIIVQWTVLAHISWFQFLCFWTSLWGPGVLRSIGSIVAQPSLCGQHMVYSTVRTLLKTDWSGGASALVFCDHINPRKKKQHL